MDNIYGWFNDGHKDMYDIFVKQANDGDSILEIGCFLGKSSIYLANKIKQSKKDIKLYCVDLFSIRPDYPGNKVLREALFKKNGSDALPQFKSLMSKYNVTDIVVPFKMSSHEALDLFIDQGKKFKYIFIDGGHDYEIVKPDIEKSLLLIEKNGIIAGDDYFTSKKDDQVQKAVDELLKPHVKFHKQAWVYYS